MSVTGIVRLLCNVPARILFVLCLLLSVGTIGQQKVTISNTLTVVKIMAENDNGYTLVSFLRTARIYKLPATGKHYKRYIGLLKKSEQRHTPVIIKRTSENSEIILSVEAVTNKNGK